MNKQISKNIAIFNTAIILDGTLLLALILLLILQLLIIAPGGRWQW